MARSLKHHYACQVAMDAAIDLLHDGVANTFGLIGLLNAATPTRGSARVNIQLEGLDNGLERPLRLYASWNRARHTISAKGKSGRR